MVGCRTGLVLALITMVTSEMIVRQAGIGNLLFNSLDLAQYSATYATIVIVGVLGFVLDLAVRESARHRSRLGRSRASDRGGLGMTAQRRMSELAIGTIPILLLLGLWYYLTAFKIAPPTLLPPPGLVFARFVTAARRSDFPVGMPRSRCIGCSAASGSR